MQLQDVKHLASLARLEISEEEQQALLGDLTSILGYIDQINGVELKDFETSVPEHRNRFREDVVTNEPGSNTKAILSEVPDTQDGFVKVKKIL